MRKLLLLLVGALTYGCAANDAVRRVESPVNVTHEVAFGEYRRVFNTTYHILNRYGVIQKSSYRYGEITALVSEDTRFHDKTRRTIQARIFDNGDYWDVECRVLTAIEDSQPATFQDQFHPRYDWKTVASDPRLEVRLNNEIRAALSGGAWESKEPLVPKPIRPVGAPDNPEPKERRRSSSDGDGEVSTTPPKQAARAEVPGDEAFERLGILRLRRGAYEGAERAFAEALRVEDAENPFVPYLLAQALFAQNKWDEAQASLLNGYSRAPEWVERADLDLRDFYRDGSNFARQLDPLTARASDDQRLLLGYLQLFSGQPEAALASLDRYLASHEGEACAEALRTRARGAVDRAHGLESF